MDGISIYPGVCGVVCVAVDYVGAVVFLVSCHGIFYDCTLLFEF
jgi:hypothetical protein